MNGGLRTEPLPGAMRALAQAFAHASAGRLRDALERFEHATTLDPDCGRLWRHRGDLLRRVGELGAAAACFERAIAHGDDGPLNAFFLSAIGVGPVMPAAPAGFVASLYDQYAERFDDHLVGELAYRAPAVLAELVRRSDGRRSFDAAIDLGCGTGLSGAAFRGHCRTLIGVDLSTEMLARARRRDVYDGLVHADMVEALHRRPDAADLVVCCDALIYLGDLGPLFDAVRGALRAGGSWGFTVEACEAEYGFDLLPSLRYSHSERYLRNLAAEYGFEVRALEAAELRVQAGEPVRGLAVHMVPAEGSRGR